MRGGDDAELFGQPQGFKKFVIRYPERAFVGQEDLEAAHPKFDDFFEIAFRLVIITRYAHVKSEVASAVALGLAPPKLESFQRFVGASGTDHFDQRGGAADQRRATGGRVRVLGEGAHERQMNVDVWIDKARKDIFAGRVDHFSPRRRRNISVNT